jgi:hypothetical protein
VFGTGHAVYKWDRAPRAQYVRLPGPLSVSSGSGGSRTPLNSLFSTGGRSPNPTLSAINKPWQVKNLQSLNGWRVPVFSLKPPPGGFPILSRMNSCSTPLGASSTFTNTRYPYTDGPIPSRPDDPEEYKRFLRLPETRGVVEGNIRQFERGMRQGRVLRLKDTTHGGFVSDAAKQRIFRSCDAAVPDGQRAS